MRHVLSGRSVDAILSARPPLLEAARAPSSPADAFPAGHAATSRRPNRSPRIAAVPPGRVSCAVAGLIAGLATLATAGPARADETVYAAVEGFQVLRSDDPKDTTRCRMFRQYTNKKDNGNVSAISASPGDHAVVVSVVYIPWTWAKDTTYQTRLSIDRELINAKQTWYGAGSALAAKLPEALLPKLYAGHRIVLGFTDGDRDFDLTGFRPAYAATLKCNAEPLAAPEASAAATPPPPPPAPPAPAPTPPVAAAPTPAKAPVAASADEVRAVAYLVGAYERWAVDACDMASSRKQRDVLDARLAGLKPAVASFEPRLSAAGRQLDPGRCPPAALLESTLQLLIDNTDRDFVDKADPRTVSEFLGLVRPIVAARTPAPPAVGTTPPAPAAKAQGLPAKDRLEAYLFGLGVRDTIPRCDIATTAKQRAALDALLAALTPEMTAVEAAARQSVERYACPDEQEAAAILSTIGDGSPDSVARAINKSRPGGVSAVADKILAAAAPATPPVPSEPRMASYLYGLVMQDAIKRCDIRSTGRQREALDAKLAANAPEMATVEPALREQIKVGGEACPPPDQAAALEAALPVWIEKSPEDFAAEMDRRSAQKAGPAKP